MENHKYKRSKYNIYFRDNNIQTVYNTLTNQRVSLPIRIYNELFIESFDNETILTKKGIFIPTDFDETQKLLDEQNHLAYSYDTLNLIIAPTMACNYKCKYCFEANTLCNNSNMTKDIMDETVSFIKNQVNEHKDTVKRISIKWFGGEPLINKEAIKYITDKLIENVLKPYHLQYQSSMYSNCRLLTEETANMLKDCNVGNTVVTIDGLKNTYTYQKGCTEKDYDITMENIKRAESILNNITIAINVSKFNKDEVIPTIKYLREYGINSLIYLNIVACYTPNNKNDSNSIELKEFMEICDRAALLENVSVTTLFKRRYITCEASHDYHYVIAPDGHIYRCEHMLNKREHSIGTVQGGIHNKPQIPDIWVNNKIPEKCINCPIFPICCMNGCTTNHVIYGLNTDCDDRINLIINKLKNSIKTYTRM